MTNTRVDIIRAKRRNVKTFFCLKIEECFEEQKYEGNNTHNPHLMNQNKNSNRKYNVTKNYRETNITYSIHVTKTKMFMNRTIIEKGMHQNVTKNGRKHLQSYIL